MQGCPQKQLLRKYLLRTEGRKPDALSLMFMFGMFILALLTYMKKK
ncbi:putative holin-like toxin [Paenibacillus sp. p3-SID867]|nr:putative holin-like toxin [Paenibacillus sp. p3-SID867]